jgi:hypothetical protein
MMWGCPGAFATDAEVEQYRERYDRAAAEQTSLYDSWFGSIDPSSWEQYSREGFGLVAGAPWTIPALDMNRVIWNVR